MKVNGKVFFLLLTFAATLTGCGFMETQTNIDQGMKAVNELHYDTASTHFETAILEEEDKELSFRGLGLASMGKAEYEKAMLETEQYKKQSQLELNKTNRQLQDAQNKVNLSKLAYEQSQEAYRIRQNRFAQGLEKTTDLLQSETQMIQKELEQLQAVFEYQFTQEYLGFLSE